MRTVASRISVRHASPVSPHNRDSGRAASWRAKRSLPHAENRAGGDRRGLADFRPTWVWSFERIEMAPGGFGAKRAGAGFRGAPETGQKGPTQKRPRSRAPCPARSVHDQREHTTERSRERAGVAGRCSLESGARDGRISLWHLRGGGGPEDVVARIQSGQAVRVGDLLIMGGGDRFGVAMGCWGTRANLEFSTRGRVFRFQSNASSVTPRVLALGWGRRGR